MSHPTRRAFVGALGSAAITCIPGTSLGASTAPGENSTFNPYQVAAYYFGNYHVDPRNEAQHGPGWTEWQLVQQARPRFQGHRQPKVPLWGYQDESDPAVFEHKIKAAAEAGISAFIFDWYWYNDGPFLESALEKGYLGARNKSDLKFAIMWANHDWFDIHPAKLASSPQLQFPGKVTPETFDKITDHVVNTYFKSPSYWTIDRCPYFSIYELFNFVASMGGADGAARAIADFRKKTKAAGFPDLHFNAVTWGVKLLPGQTDVPDVKALLQQLHVDSTTSYVWLHHAQLASFPVTQYEAMQKTYEAYRATASATVGKPYFPNVSMGWDSSPRACQSDIYLNKGYPFLPVVQGNTPAAFGKALRSARHFLDNSPDLKQKVLTINSWNEWTEGSYLEPDTVQKYAYLDQIRDVFGKR
jgi:hypothetical protein